MRRVPHIITAIVFTASFVTPSFADDDRKLRRPNESDATVIVFRGPQSSNSSVRMTSKTELDPRPTGDSLSPDEVAILGTAESYSAAYFEANAKAISNHFTRDAEYIDGDGVTYRGRDAIEKLFTAFFAANPRTKLELEINALHFVSPTVAVEDGTTTLTFPDDTLPVTVGYTAVHVKEGGKWQTASVREHRIQPLRQHRGQIEQLSWLVGDWIHEGEDSVVRFSCRPVDNGNFLLRSFSVTSAGKPTMNGTQRIGWDPRAGKFRAWVFDSDGGYAEGYFHRDGEKWVLKLMGVTPDGDASSNTSIYTSIDARTMTFQSVDHEVAGVELPDSDPVTIVRQSPKPE